MGSFKASMEVAFPLCHLGLPLLLLLLFTGFNHGGKLVLADDKLIKLQCHNAEVPATCIECLKSDPRGQEADEVGIAAIVISCISSNAEALANNMSTLASTVHDKDLKATFQDCKKGFSQAKDDLKTATNELRSKDYDKTNHLVRTALEQDVVCKKNLVYLRAFIPSYILNGTRVFEELSNAAMRIIDRF